MGNYWCMSCTCMELESKHGESQCKCVQYRELFPDCACEGDSVSAHSPGIVADNEILVRTVFREQHLDSDGYLTPQQFRQDPGERGFSVDRLLLSECDHLMSVKQQDPRFNGFLRFVAAQTSNVRELKQEGRRLFCVYDSGSAQNRLHADICQNLYIESGVPQRKKQMGNIARRLREVFGKSQLTPQDCYL